MPPTAHDTRIIEQFTRQAEQFARHPIHSEPEAMARLFRAAMVGPETRVLDVACGPGIVACAVARYAARVTGIDLTPAMIAQARKRQDREGLMNVEWRVGDATGLPFTDRTFDVVLTRYSFHHMTEPVLALGEMRRVCRPGGRLVVTDATPSAEAQARYNRLERLRDPSHTSALTLDQLRALGRENALSEAVIDGYGLEARLDTIAYGRGISRIAELLESDIATGEDRTGLAPQRRTDGLWIRFPISIVAWVVPPDQPPGRPAQVT